MGQLTQAEAAALRVQAENADSLQPLREEEATRAAVLHRIQVERDTLDREEKRAAEREAELKARLEQVQKDAEREDHAIAEAREVLARFDREEEAIKAQGDGSEAREEAAARAEAALDMLNDAEAALSALTAKSAELRAERRQLEAQIAEHNARASRFAQQEADIGRQAAELRARNAAASPVETLREEVAEIEAQLESIEEGIVAGRGNRRGIARQGKGYARGGPGGAAQGQEPRNRGRNPHQAAETGRGRPLQAHRRPNLRDARLRNRTWLGLGRRSRRDRRPSIAHPLEPRQRHRRRPCPAPGRRAAVGFRSRAA